VEQLRGNEGVAAVDSLRQFFQPRDEAIIAYADHLLHAARVLVNRASPRKEKGGTPSGALLVEGHKTFRHFTLVVAVAEMHRRHDDAVLQGKRSDLDGRKEIIHGGSPLIETG